MLGRHHLLLSLFTVIILFIPYFDERFELTLIVLIGIAIGSLIPDADSPDAAIFHEHIRGIPGNLGKLVNNLFAGLFPIFGIITKYAIYIPAVFVLGHTILKKYHITERHRGFLHSFIGIGTATILTGTYLLVFLFLFELFSYVYFIAFMIAYILGALLHLLEDSSTKTGIQFNYPFSNLVLYGRMITRPEFAKPIDIFTGFFGLIILLLFFAIELDYIVYPNWIITLSSIIFVFVVWLIFLLIIARVKFRRGELQSYSNVKSLF